MFCLRLRNAAPTTYLPATLITAMKRCGASSDFGSVTGTPAGIINYRGSYILVGIPDIGVGNGIQRYAGNSTVSGDPNAWIDLRISVKDGDITYISG